MSRVSLAVILLGAGCAAHRPGRPSIEAGPVDVAISESWTCPLPPSRGYMKVEPDGKATLTVMAGMSFPPEGPTTRNRKQLSAGDMRDLEAVLARIDWRAMPDRVQSFPPRYNRTDPCSHSLEIRRGGVVKTISYSDEDVPSDLEELVRGIDGVVERHPWEEERWP